MWHLRRELTDRSLASRPTYIRLPLTEQQFGGHPHDTLDAYRSAGNVRWVPAVNPPPHGTHPDGKPLFEVRPIRVTGTPGSRAAVVRLPVPRPCRRGRGPARASSNDAIPNGIPMIVMHSSTPVIRWPIAIQSPGEHGPQDVPDHLRYLSVTTDALPRQWFPELPRRVRAATGTSRPRSLARTRRSSRTPSSSAARCLARCWRSRRAAVQEAC